MPGKRARSQPGCWSSVSLWDRSARRHLLGQGQFSCIGFSSLFSFFIYHSNYIHTYVVAKTRESTTSITFFKFPSIHPSSQNLLSYQSFCPWFNQSRSFLPSFLLSLSWTLTIWYPSASHTPTQGNSHYTSIFLVQYFYYLTFISPPTLVVYVVFLYYQKVSIHLFHSFTISTDRESSQWGVISCNYRWARAQFVQVITWTKQFNFQATRKSYNYNSLYVFKQEPIRISTIQ